MKKLRNAIEALKNKIYNKLGKKKIEQLKKVLRVARVVKNIVCWTMIIVLAFAVISFLLTRVTGGTPSVFGYTLHRIETGSMVPALEVEDVILNKDISSASELHVGDIITFQGDSRFENRKVTHRVLVTPYDNGYGEIVLVTKGDANDIDDGEILFSSVESKFVTKVGLLRALYSFFFSPWGLIIFIMLLGLIFFDELLNIVKITSGHYEEEEPENISEIIERIQREEKEKQERERLLAEQAEEERKQKARENNVEATEEINEVSALMEKLSEDSDENG